jgi:hypothetical protein
MRKSIVSAVLVLSVIMLHAAKMPAKAELIQNYITQYLNIATFESVRSGIPVSIILAQGIHESQCGNSKLAQEGNNHFGIKWTSASDMPYMMQYDDEKNANGTKKLSYFIKYPSAEASFTHHSDFLMKKERYRSLFQYERTDYRNWAKGLSKCGYATDPNYATRLINIIESNQLFQYDIPMVLELDDQNAETEAIAYNKEEITTNDNVYINTTEVTSKTEFYEVVLPNDEPANTKNPQKYEPINEFYEVTTTDADIRDKPLNVKKETTKSKPKNRP